MTAILGVSKDETEVEKEPTYSIDLIDADGESYFAVAEAEEPLFNPQTQMLSIVTNDGKKITILNPPTVVIAQE